MKLSKKVVLSGEIWKYPDKQITHILDVKKIVKVFLGLWYDRCIRK